MADKINPVWMRGVVEEITRLVFTQDHTVFTPKILSYNPAAKWLVTALAERGFTARVENLGAGVKRIGIAGTCCKLCGRKD